MLNLKKIFTLFIGILLFLPLTLSAQTEEGADSCIVQALRQKGIHFSHDNSVTLLMSGQEKFDDLFKAVEQAKSSIHMEYFNFRNDSINRELTRRLAKKAAEGVEVRCLFDGFGNASNNQPMRKEDITAMRKMGIQIYEYKPMCFPWIHDIFNRDHRKIVVIDGRVAYTGGMNVADYYIKGTREVGSWHDMHCRIEGSEVNTLQWIFTRMWKRVTGEEIHGPKYYSGCTNTAYFKGLKPDTTVTAGHKMVGIINREPHRTQDIIRSFYVHAINCAHDSIKIINPYFTLSHQLLKALKNAVRRGVKVDIMLSVRGDVPFTPDVGFHNAHRLMKEGCHIWLFKPGFHHTKIITVDGKFCTVGSANLDGRSLRWDYECNAVIVDGPTTAQLDRHFANNQRDCFLLTPETWKKFRSPWQKFKGSIGSLIRNLL